MFYIYKCSSSQPCQEPASVDLSTPCRDLELLVYMIKYGHELIQCFILYERGTYSRSASVYVRTIFDTSPAEGPIPFLQCTVKSSDGTVLDNCSILLLHNQPRPGFVGIIKIHSLDLIMQRDNISLIA